MTDQSSGGLPIRIVGGAVYGALAFVASFVAVVALFLKRVNENAQVRLEDLTSGDHVVELAGWIFYNAHTVDVTGTASRAGVGAAAPSYNFVAEPYVADPTTFQAIPAVVLFVAGYLVARRTGFDLDLVSGALAGASVAIGYGALAYAGTTVFAVTTAGVTFAPAMPDALLVAGLAYPAVAGGAAGALRGL
jgi:hypothetical protein